MTRTRVMGSQKDFWDSLYQEIPSNTLYSECYYSIDNCDKWNYFLTEIKNPDSSISNFFINILNKPFILTTYIDNRGVCCSEHYIKLIDYGKLYYKYKNNDSIIIKLDGNNIRNNYDTLLTLEKELGKYFNKSFIKYLISYIKNKKQHFSISD